MIKLYLLRKYISVKTLNQYIVHQIKNPLRGTSEHIAIIYFQTFTKHIIRMVQD